MHKTLRSLTLITFLLASAPLQAKPSGAQLAAKGLIKIYVGTIFALQTLGGIAFTAIMGRSLRDASIGKQSLFYTGTLSGIAGLGSLSCYLIRTGFHDLSRSPANTDDKKSDDDDDDDENKD